MDVLGHDLPDWRCECGDLNRRHEAFCYRCGAVQPEAEDEVISLHQQLRGAVEALREFQDAYVREFGMGHGSDFVIRHVQTITDRLGGQ